ncbi:cation:proton antiporter [Phaeovulum sp.]|uniref:cation:proton antiporter domain-containing protein n=1 Tax=Phaeovulum sp. TaxID=2934796 RepID=UPI00273186B0|nr:cation:proton antiporter [Phaeovulum sp.]MDP1669434.1 cation:proton antiporter [Phaeovulum sp.]MDZ4118287.1 cation:proton antiporter [Phaeovulum sp.]
MDAFLFQASLYLIAMVVAVPVAARLGLGSVLGYLLIGLLIGPVTGLVGSEMRDLQHIAEFGVVMMLFLIGLELDPRALWAMRGKLIGLGGLQVLGTMALITALLVATGQEWRVSLALGMIFSLSSTAIVLQTMTEKRLMQTAGGRASFAVLLTQDIAVIPMLALMPLLALPGARAVAQADNGSGAVGDFLQSLPAWGAALTTFGAVAAVILGGHYLIRPLFRYVHAAKLREINTAMALMIVMVIASMMTLVGLSPALGTFLAGVVLANSEFKHELESSIEPFKGLLLGMFFITVGAGMNFAPLITNPPNIIGLVLALVGLKAGLLYALGRAYGLFGRDRWLFTLGLAQAGEFGFVLVSFALGQRILPEALAQKVLLIVALSMLITPVLFILLDRLGPKQRPGPQTAPDAIDDPRQIIIAGVGRFGQGVNRMVTMSGFKTTVLDNDLKTIQLMRKFGFKAYFGDPTRPDLLSSAGLQNASVLVICLDDYAASTRLVAYARRVRPDLHIVARARDRVHVFELVRAGANDVVRELFDSSLRAARYVLENVGLSEFEAAEAQRIFYKLDREGLRDLAQVWKPGVPVENNSEYMELSRAQNRDLENALMTREKSAQTTTSGSPHEPT